MKPIVKKAFKSLLWCTGIPAFLRRIGNRKTIILAYHRVCPADAERVFDRTIARTEPEMFENHMQYIARHYTPISLDRFVMSLQRREKPPRNSVVITFDDGYRDVYDYALPVLQRHGIPATVFVVAGDTNSGRALWWERVAHCIAQSSIDPANLPWLAPFVKGPAGKEPLTAIALSRLKQMDAEESEEAIEDLVHKTNAPPTPSTLLSWGMMLEMVRSGITFGSHTMHHQILTRTSLRAAKREIRNSKELLEKKVQTKIRHFSYPHGYESDYNFKIKEMVVRAGFVSAVTMQEGWNDSKADLLALRRIAVGTDDHLLALKLKLVGLPELRRRFRRLIKT